MKTCLDQGSAERERPQLRWGGVQGFAHRGIDSAQKGLIQALKDEGNGQDHCCPSLGAGCS